MPTPLPPPLQVTAGQSLYFHSTPFPPDRPALEDIRLKMIAQHGMGPHIIRDTKVVPCGNDRLSVKFEGPLSKAREDSAGTEGWWDTSYFTTIPPQS